MLNAKQNAKLLEKLSRCLTVFEPYMFRTLAQADYKTYQTKEHLYTIPDETLFSAPPEEWGGEWMNCWFRGSFTPPREVAGKPLYIQPHLGGYEGMLWVNGEPCGAFATKIVVTRHGNHYCCRVCEAADPSQPIDFAIEFYAGHRVIGCRPFEEYPNSGFRFPCGTIDLCEKVQPVADFLYDLRVLTQLAETLDESSFRRAEVMRTLTAVHQVLLYDPEQAERDAWLASLAQARALMQPSLQRHNGDSAPTAVLTGHSHMDTAWLWPVGETIRKNARTIANQMNLMDQFPEYRFIQSSALHTQMIEEHYPQIFAKMKGLIQQGRYEPNGGVWIECDCNITGGEALIRQFLWGQRYTREKFGYLADCFWLPDTFGYSAAIPQIMKGFGIDFFLTTKMAWNDTNRFPYDTFRWEGIDHTEVLAHLFVMDTWVDPKSLLERINGIQYPDGLHRKQACDERLVAFGYGDGGGGPTFEMIETARRMADLEGSPRTRYASVSDFMWQLAANHPILPRYTGELYLELHRGTLTGKQQIKRNNRKGEIALHTLELLEVMAAVAEKRAASTESTRELWGTLLLNQFHDILPGSCIAVAHQQSIAQTNAMLREAERQTADWLSSGEAAAPRSLFNPLGFARRDVAYLPAEQALVDPTGALKTQPITTLDGEPQLAISGLTQQPFAFTPIPLVPGEPSGESPFSFDGTTLQTPFATVRFDADRRIASFIDKRTGRELCAGIPLGAFVSAEDVPAAWDAWDVDADWGLKCKAESGNLISSEVAADGAVEFRLRNRCRVCRNSEVLQDVIFYADSPLVTFDTKLVWEDKHQFLKAMFDTTIHSAYATHEIQFGSLKRATSRNNTFEQAKFEVCCHKYVDLSEPAYGVAVLNDCKYGVSVEGGRIGLSLAKGGMRPDEFGDVGVYRFRYGFLPHLGDYRAETVTLPAYCFNAPSHASSRAATMTQPLLTVDAPNLIIETVKPCEDAERAFIARIYEAEGSFTRGRLSAGFPCESMEICNMLEEPLEPCGGDLTFRPFEIQTIKLRY